MREREREMRERERERERERDETIDDSGLALFGESFLSQQRLARMTNLISEH